MTKVNNIGADPCKLCLCKGDYFKCLKQTCYMHKSWINQQHITKLTSLQKIFEAYQVLVNQANQIIVNPNHSPK